MLLNTLSTKNDRDSKSDYKRLNDIMLTTEEWDLIRDLIPVLQPFAAATEILGGSSYCTYSIMNPILIDIKKRFYPLTEGGIRAIRQININGNNFETPFNENRRKSQNAFAVFASLKKKVSPENDEVGAYLLLDEIDFDSNPFVW